MKNKHIVLFALFIFLRFAQALAAEQPKNVSGNLSVIQYDLLAKTSQNKRPDLVSFFADMGQAQKNLFTWLNRIPHSETRDLPCGISARPEAIFNFSLPQLIHVYLILYDLENSDLLDQIGKTMGGYDENQYYEPGGLANLRQGHLVLEPQLSSIGKPIPDTIGAFFNQPGYSKKLNAFWYHVHPYNNGRQFPGPSCKIEADTNNGVILDFDIGTALKIADFLGDSNELLISRRRGHMINLIYYGAEELTGTFNKFSLCKKLQNFRIISLGNWQYRIPKK